MLAPPVGEIGEGYPWHYTPINPTAKRIKSVTTLFICPCDFWVYQPSTTVCIMEGHEDIAEKGQRYLL